MTKDLILKALEDDELKKKLMEELEVEELEDRSVASLWPWMCYRPAIP